MSQSELINELAAALSKAQGEMQAAIKDKVNPFFKSKYADLGSIWDAARPVLGKHGLCIMQTTELNNEKNQVIMVTTLAHTSGHWMKSYIPLNPAKNDSQGMGAAITYLRRYSLSAIVGVVCDEDDDGETAVGRGKTTATPNSATNVEQSKQNIQQAERLENSQIIAINSLKEKLDDSSQSSFLDWVKEKYKVSKIEDIPRNWFEDCMINLNKKIKYLNDQQRVVA